jgi:thioredoxin 1
MPTPEGRITQLSIKGGDLEEGAMITEITGQNFDEEVLKSDLPVFACFTNAQCGSCFALCLVIDDLAKEYEGRMKFVRIDVEKQPELATRYDILPLPAVLLFQGSEPVKKLLGFHYKGSVRHLLDSVITGTEHSA